MKKESVEKPQALLLTILKHKSLDYLKARAHEQEAFDAMQEWRSRELAIRISTLEACDPDYIFSDEIRSIMADTLKSFRSRPENLYYEPF